MKKIIKALALTMVLAIAISAMAVPAFASRYINNAVDSSADPYFEFADILVVAVQERRDVSALVKNTADGTVTYTSTDSDIAAVSANGIVKAYKKGTCYIIADTTDALGNVIDREVVYINSVNNYQEDYGAIKLEIGESFNIIDLFKPALSERSVESISTLPLYVSVNKETGVVTARKLGTTTVTVTYKDANGDIWTYPVTVQILEK